jgi:hypothetical protein
MLRTWPELRSLEFFVFLLIDRTGRWFDGDLFCLIEIHNVEVSYVPIQELIVLLVGRLLA